MATNQLVSKLRKFLLPASLATAAALGSALLLPHDHVRAAVATASPLDDNSVAALTAMDHAMESLAARVTPAIVNVAVTSRAEAQPVDMGA